MTASASPYLDETDPRERVISRVLESKRQEGETLGETVERLSHDFSLHEWAMENWDGIDDGDRAEVAETLREVDDEDHFAEPDALFLS